MTPAVATLPAVDLRDTPVVTIDLDAMEANIRRLQAYCDAHNIANRPHIKTHKIPQIASEQLEAGAVGITCQKLGEVAVMLDAGISDILVTYNILGEAKVGRLAEYAAQSGGRVSVACDNAVWPVGSPTRFQMRRTRCRSLWSATPAWDAPACRRRPKRWSWRRRSRASRDSASRA